MLAKTIHRQEEVTMRATIIMMLIAVVTGSAGSAAAKKNPLRISINKSDVDLENRTLYFKINRPADSAEIKVLSPEGKLLAERTEVYNGARAGTRLSIKWPKLLGKNQENFRLELKVTDVNEYWIGWEVIKFYLEIPHEDVVFETAKWEIRPSESPKLDAALKLLIDAVNKYEKNMDCQIYVAGHTDTVGSIASNRELSRQRANAIARYFRSHGLRKIPLFVRGFGEEALAVDTGDNVDEQRNRRAQYILATFPPAIAGPGSWQRVQ
jgi:outer membrane protein OmpA-like peptidoglycan-associated protein